MIKVTMNLTEADSAAVDDIHSMLKTRSKAQAVSFALAVGRFLLSALHRSPRAELLIRNEDGSLDRILMPQIESSRVPAAAAAKLQAKGVLKAAG